MISIGLRYQIRPQMPADRSVESPCCGRVLDLASNVQDQMELNQSTDSSYAELDAISTSASNIASSNDAAHNASASTNTSRPEQSQSSQTQNQKSETAVKLSSESKSQFVNSAQTSAHTAPVRETVPLRTTSFAHFQASQSFHSASNYTQSSLRNFGSKGGEITTTKAVQTQLQSSGRTEVRASSNAQTASNFSTQNLLNINIKTPPNAIDLKSNIGTSIPNEVTKAFPTSGYTGSRILTGNIRSFQGSGILASPNLPQNIAVNPNATPLSNKGFTNLLQSVAKSFPLLSGLPLSLQNFVVPLFKNLGLESLRISSQKFAEALTGSKTIAPSASTPTREIAPQRAMNFSIQFFAKLEKNMLNFFNIMQGAYLKTPEGEISEGDLLTQQLALLRNLQEKNEKKERKKKAENKDEFLMVRVQTKQDLLEE